MHSRQEVDYIVSESIFLEIQEPVGVAEIFKDKSIERKGPKTTLGNTILKGA